MDQQDPRDTHDDVPYQFSQYSDVNVPEPAASPLLLNF
jgi:hypothetical protein